MGNLMGDGAADSDDNVAKQQHEMFFVPSKPKVKHNWIEWFCQFSQHDYIVEVDLSFLRDQFNLLGLKDLFKGQKNFNFKEILKQVQSPIGPSELEMRQPTFADKN